MFCCCSLEVIVIHCNYSVLRWAVVDYSYTGLVPICWLLWYHWSLYIRACSCYDRLTLLLSLHCERFYRYIVHGRCRWCCDLISSCSILLLIVRYIDGVWRCYSDCGDWLFYVLCYDVVIPFCVGGCLRFFIVIPTLLFVPFVDYGDTVNYRYIAMNGGTSTYDSVLRFVTVLFCSRCCGCHSVFGDLWNTADYGDWYVVDLYAIITVVRWAYVDELLVIRCSGEFRYHYYFCPRCMIPFWCHWLLFLVIHILIFTVLLFPGDCSDR